MKKVRGPSTAWILLGVLGGGLLGMYAPFESEILGGLQWSALALMVFLVVVSLPLLSVGRAIAKPRVLVALFAVNLVAPILPGPAATFASTRRSASDSCFCSHP